MKQLDAIGLGIAWDRLIAITNEILIALVRTSFSTIVRESYDLSCVICDTKGRSIAQGTYSVPPFTGTAPATLRHMLAKFPPDTLRPGDVVATNDPWMGTGHVYDISVMRPVFYKGNIVAYTMSITHLPDIGGLGFSATAREIYEEGLRLPICKLVKAGVLNEELFELIATNVRVPEQTLGDLHANIACNEVGERLLLEFMDEYGIDDLTPIADAIVQSSEAAIREKIRGLPNGTYANSLQIEGEDGAITLACTVDIRGDGIAVDFTGTSKAINFGINVPLVYSASFAMYCAKCITVPAIPNNSGFAAPIRVTGPANCILNALPPYPTGGRHVIGWFVAPLIFGALAEALPDKVQADTGMHSLMNVQGRNRSGRMISSIYFAAGGFGALKGMDGWATTPGPSNMTGMPVEVWEGLSGMIIERKALVTDSGGPGQSRGGLGQEIVLVNDSGNELKVFFIGSRTEFPARGLLGGGSGSKRQYRINDAPVHPKGRYILKPGDVVTMTEPGGGGFGDPAQRAPEAVLRDVLADAVSVAAARSVYGVEVDPKRRTAHRIPQRDAAQ